MKLNIKQTLNITVNSVVPNGNEDSRTSTSGSNSFIHLLNDRMMSGAGWLSSYHHVRRAAVSRHKGRRQNETLV